MYLCMYYSSKCTDVRLYQYSFGTYPQKRIIMSYNTLIQLPHTLYNIIYPIQLLVYGH